MKKGSVKLLQMIAVSLQAVALVITLGMTAVQGTIKTLFTYSEEVVEVVSVPVDVLLWTTLLLVVYVAGMLVIYKSEERMTKVKAGILVGIAGLFQILSQYTGTVASSLIAMEGVNALASYSVLRTIITQVTTPFVWSAFALFCLSCGGYVGLESKVIGKGNEFEVEGLPFIVTKNSKEALRQQAVAMLMLDLKRAEERAENEGWIDADDLERELGIID